VNWLELVGGYAIEQEDRAAIAAASVDPVYASTGDIPERVDPRRSKLHTDGWIRVENQGSIGSCFPAGVLVTMADGIQKPIEDLKYGEFVLSHNRIARRVIDTMRRDYTGDMYEFFVQGWGRLEMTADHVIPVRRKNGVEWVRADEVMPDDLMLVSSGVESAPVTQLDVANFLDGIPVIEDGDRLAGIGAGYSMPRYLILDELTCWALGLFVAEGSTDFSPSGLPHRSVWTLHTKETKYVRKLTEWARSLGLDIEVSHRKGSKAQNVRICCGVLASFLKNVCGRFCNKKRVPVFILNGSHSQKLAFLRGYYDGDGSCAKNDRECLSANGSVYVLNQIHCATASRELAIQVSQLAVSVGMKPGRTLTRARGHQRFDSHQVYLYGTDACKMYPSELHNREESRRHLISDELGQWRKIREINVHNVEDLPVFDITVEQDHSFIADGIGVHNCQGNSLSECLEYCHVVAGGDIVQLSRMYAYLRSQQFDNIRTDSGSTLSGGTKAAKDGICLESIAPYPRAYPGWGFITQSMKDAAIYKLGSLTEIKKAEDVRSFIGSGIGIVHIGIAWNSSMTPDSRGCITSWRSGGGGHAVVFAGYVPDADVGVKSSAGWWALLKNSWGTNWGLQGWAYVDPRCIDQMLQHQWTVMVGRSDMVSPNPRPVPIDFTKRSLFG
jgi:intein/homing endonuclease